MGKDKMIMVIKKELLFRDNAQFSGFRSKKDIDYESRILNNFEYQKRSEMEINPNFKQPIAYSLIINPKLKKVFAYQRSNKDANYGEKRLQGKWSWGVGGHIEKIDVQNDNPIYASMSRESLNEEIEISGKIVGMPLVLGYINDDSNEVGKVHFGILYGINTDSKIIKPKDPEIERGELKTVKELEEICSNTNLIVEEWSKIALEPLKDILR